MENEEFFDKLHSAQDRTDSLLQELERIERKHKEDSSKYLDINKLITKIIEIKSDYHELKVLIIPKDHPEGCKCECVVCGEDHRKIQGQNPYKCSEDGFCPYWSCC